MPFDNWTWTIWYTPDGQPDIAVYGPWLVDDGPGETNERRGRRNHANKSINHHRRARSARRAARN